MQKFCELMHTVFIFTEYNNAIFSQIIQKLMNNMNALHVVPKINLKVKQIISYQFTLTPFPSTPKV